jgi:hypothetical protein
MKKLNFWMVFIGLIFLNGNFLFANETITLRAGDPQKAYESIKNIAIDLTPGLEIVGPNGEWPLEGIYWELKDFDLIISFPAEKNDKGEITTKLGYWTKKDFSQGKETRDGLVKYASSIELDLKKCTYEIYQEGQLISSNVKNDDIIQSKEDSRHQVHVGNSDNHKPKRIRSLLRTFILNRER